MFLRGLPTLQRNNMLKRSLMILCGLTAAAGLSIISTSVSPSLCFVSGHLQNRLSRYSGTSTQERTSPPRQGSNARPGVKPWGYKGNRLGGVHPADGFRVLYAPQLTHKPGRCLRMKDGDDDSKEAAVLRRDLLETYTTFAVPAVAFALASVACFITVFSLVFTSLQATGRGYDDLVNLLEPFPWAKPILDVISPSIGNVGVTFIILEILSPIVIVVSTTLATKFSSYLSENLSSWGLDAEGLDKKLQQLAQRS